jgi:hypothetical protein
VGVAASPIATATVAQQDYTGAPTAVVDFQLVARRIDQSTVELRWRALRTTRARFAYRVYRDAKDACTIYPTGAPACLYSGTPIATTTVPLYVDRTATGGFVYRVALVAGWSTEQTSSDVLLLSRPVTVPAR